MVPDATIAIPAYNASRYLDECLDSAVSQRFDGRFEILVADDGSMDDTRDILDRWRERSTTPIRVFHLPHQGICATRNHLLEAAASDCLIGLDADDRLRPGAVSEIVTAFRNFPDAGFVYTDSCYIDERGELLFVGEKAGCHAYFDELIHHTHFPGHVRAYRRSLLPPGTRFDERFPVGQDWDFLLQVTGHFRKVHIPKVLVDYRVHPSGISATSGPDRGLELTLELLKMHIRRNRLYPQAQTVEIEVHREGLHAIYYQHVVDGRPMLAGSAKTAMLRYFERYR